MAASSESDNIPITGLVKIDEISGSKQWKDLEEQIRLLRVEDETDVEETNKINYIYCWYQFCSKFSGAENFNEVLDKMMEPFSCGERQDGPTSESLESKILSYILGVANNVLDHMTFAQFLLDLTFGLRRFFTKKSDQPVKWLTTILMVDRSFAESVLYDYLTQWSEPSWFPRGYNRTTRTFYKYDFGHFVEMFTQKFGFVYLINMSTIGHAFCGVDCWLKCAVMYGTPEAVQFLLNGEVRFSNIDVMVSTLSRSNIQVKSLRLILAYHDIDQHTLDLITTGMVESINEYNRGKLTLHNDRLLKLLLFMGGIPQQSIGEWPMIKNFIENVQTTSSITEDREKLKGGFALHVDIDTAGYRMAENE